MQKVKLVKQVKLNLGCGDTKISGYINIDAEKTCKPDLVLDLKRQNLPYKKDTVDEVIMFHTIEHIEKRLHGRVLTEIARVLKPTARLYLSYPNFWECAKRWCEAVGDKRTWWEATLYGRQLYKGDYHVCIMEPDELTNLLYECGFKGMVSYPEQNEPFNSVTIAVKDPVSRISYETAIAQDMQSMVVRVI